MNSKFPAHATANIKWVPERNIGDFLISRKTEIFAANGKFLPEPEGQLFSVIVQLLNKQDE